MFATDHALLRRARQARKNQRPEMPRAIAAHCLDLAAWVRTANYGASWARGTHKALLLHARQSASITPLP